jgi:DNA-directed RNA polymerase II subunit RPB1
MGVHMRSAVPSAPRGRRIKAICARMLTAQDIRRLAVCNIQHRPTNEKTVPHDSSLNSLRLGTMDPKNRCATCYNDLINCPGHPGVVELPFAIFHPGYVVSIAKLLRCVCPNCLQMVVASDHHKVKQLMSMPMGKARFTEFSNFLKTKRKCERCKHPLPKYAQKGLAIQRKWPHGCPNQDLDVPSTPRDCAEFLQMVDLQVYRDLGLNPDKTHPAKCCILENLLIPPQIIRPSITFTGNARARAPDDLTRRLQDILKSVHIIKDPASEAKDVERYTAELPIQIALYMNNASSVGKRLNRKRKSGQPEKSILTRLRGKKGRFRGNLMGKRVNFCGRTVITPDPNISTREIGVPERIAKMLTFPERVTVHNLSQMQKIVANGFSKLGGAKDIVRPNGEIINLRFCKHDLSKTLTVGCTVNRYIRNGDMVVVNRQPTLRKKSIMAHYVRIMPGSAIHLNPSDCGPYAADFE